MPTVGCEADAVAFQEEASSLFDPSHPPLFTDDGSYLRAPLSEASSSKNLRVEHCLCNGRDENERQRQVPGWGALRAQPAARLIRRGHLQEGESGATQG